MNIVRHTWVPNTVGNCYYSVLNENAVFAVEICAA
jgi:hypothetical protein